MKKKTLGYDECKYLIRVGAQQLLTDVITEEDLQSCKDGDLTIFDRERGVEMDRRGKWVELTRVVSNIPQKVS